jgi:ABC-type branched-subunit amino acid transport system substrate-binding protein
VARWAGSIGAAVAVAAAVTVTAPVAGAAVHHPTTRAATSSACSAANTAPGVTSSVINTGAISTLTGPIASNFESLAPGIEAYFDYVDSKAGGDGVFGRQIKLTYNTDDTGNPSLDTALAHQLIDQDHVFAVVGDASAFFNPGYFVATCTPTFGYNVTNNWAGPPNLFAAGGSTQCYACGEGGYLYLAKKVVKHPSVAILAYNIQSSSGACQYAATLFQKKGFDVSYQNYSISYGGSLVPSAQRMKEVGSNFVLSCMDVTGNINLARALQQYGVKATQLWLSGNDQSTLKEYKSLMDGVYFYTEHVPFAAPQSEFPGLKTYLAAMNKYEPKYAEDEVAIQGWQSAALLVAGIKAAGPHFTQESVIDAINKMTDFTANGLTTPVNWSPTGGAHNPPYKGPFCGAYIRAEGDIFKPVLAPAPQVFTCFKYGSDKPVAAPPGTPGA